MSDKPHNGAEIDYDHAAEEYPGQYDEWAEDHGDDYAALNIYRYPGEV